MSPLPATLLLCCVAFCASLALTLALLRLNRRWLALDHPNERSLHTEPVPRVGGIALVSGLVIANLLLGDLPWTLLVPLLLLFPISVWDDWRPLGARARLAIHLCAAGLFVLSAVDDVSLLGAAALLLGIAWMTNLYNFMDGSDGLAGGMAVFGFGAYGIVSHFAGDAALSALSFSIVAATLAFLFFNWHPARVFMGDAGSVPLGFLAGALGVIGWRQQHWPLLFPLLVFSPFIVDATITLARRLVRREKVWQAHKSHYYQRLVRMGFGHAGTALVEYGLMAAISISAVIALSSDRLEYVALIWALFYLSALPVIDYRWANRSVPE